MNRTIYLTLLCAFVAALHVPVADGREFKSTDGKVINADIVNVRGTDVVLSMAGKSFTVPISRFSAADQEYIAQWKAQAAENHVPRLRVEVNSGKSDRSDKADCFDDRKGSFEFTIKVKNEEIDFDLKGAKAYLSVIGEDAENKGRFGVMQKSSFEVSVTPGGTFEWRGDKVSYKFDDSPPSYWGVSYAGYVLQIKNAKGKVIFENAIPQAFEKKVEDVLKFGVSDAFDRDAKARGKVYIYDN